MTLEATSSTYALFSARRCSVHEHMTDQCNNLPMNACIVLLSLVVVDMYAGHSIGWFGRGIARQQVQQDIYSSSSSIHASQTTPMPRHSPQLSSSSSETPSLSSSICTTEITSGQTNRLAMIRSFTHTALIERKQYHATLCMCVQCYDISTSPARETPLERTLVARNFAFEFSTKSVRTV